MFFINNAIVLAKFFEWARTLQQYPLSKFPKQQQRTHTHVHVYSIIYAFLLIYYCYI